MNVQDLFERRNEFYLKPSSTFRGGMIACLLLGIVGIAVGGYLVDAGRVWGALLFNMLFFFSISLGGIAFSGMQDVIGAVWGRPSKRIHEAFAAFMPVSCLFLVIFLVCILFDLLGARHVYVWMVNPEMLDHFPGKNQWLVPGFMAIRDIAAVVIIFVLSMWQLRTSSLRDRLFVSGDKDKAAASAKLAKERLRFWCAPILLVYAVMYSLLTFDLLMSLSPLWFSTLWGGWLFAIMMQTLMATTLITMFILKNGIIGTMFQRQQFHDIGKMMHGFTVFFAYLTYSHILTYWYGNVPEETEYFLHRMHGPWLWIILISPIFSFVIPLYALLFQAAKWTAAAAVPLALMILISQWFTYILVVIPELNGGKWESCYLDVAGLLLTGGLFVGSYLYYGKKNPMVGLADPLLADAYSGH